MGLGNGVAVKRSRYDDDDFWRLGTAQLLLLGAALWIGLLACWVVGLVSAAGRGIAGAWRWATGRAK